MRFMYIIPIPSSCRTDLVFPRSLDVTRGACATNPLLSDRSPSAITSTSTRLYSGETKKETTHLFLEWARPTYYPFYLSSLWHCPCPLKLGFASSCLRSLAASRLPLCPLLYSYSTAKETTHTPSPIIQLRTPEDFTTHSWIHFPITVGAITYVIATLTSIQPAHRASLIACLPTG
jgi:hypothetical protein